MSTDCSFNFDEDNYDVASETNLAVTSPNFTSSSLSPHDYVIGNLKVVTPEKSPQKRKDDITIESPAKSSCDAKFSPPKPDFYDVTKTDLVPTSSLLEFEPYNKNTDSCSELMTSSQDSGVCSKSSNDVIAFADHKPESFRRSEPPPRRTEVPAKCLKPEVPAKPRNLFAKKVVTSQKDEQRSNFREKLEKMMKRQGGSMTSHPPLSRRNSSELRRNGSVTSSDVSNTPTSERIRQRLQSMPSTNSSDSSVGSTSNENLQEKLGQLLLDGGDRCRVPKAPKETVPQQQVSKQQPGKMPDDWRWRVLEHLRHKNVVPPRNCDVIRSKTPAMTSLSASALPPQMNSMTSLRPKSVTNHNIMTSSAFTRSANDVTSIPQNVKVCFLMFIVTFMVL